MSYESITKLKDAVAAVNADLYQRELDLQERREEQKRIYEARRKEFVQHCKRQMAETSPYKIGGTFVNIHGDTYTVYDYEIQHNTEGTSLQMIGSTILAKDAQGVPTRVTRPTNFLFFPPDKLDQMEAYFNALNIAKGHQK